MTSTSASEPLLRARVASEPVYRGAGAASRAAPARQGFAGEGASSISSLADEGEEAPTRKCISITYDDGSIYHGEVNENNIPDGHGKMRYNDNCYFQGRFVNGRKDTGHICHLDHKGCRHTTFIKKGREVEEEWCDCCYLPGAKDEGQNCCAVM
ncbi:MAG: hypothetical protein HYX48_06090 [Chlamydiales bacterium]|nr:hypothetical protein [Chlamydiales bacterium]